MTQNELIAYLRRMISDEQATGFIENDTLEYPDGTDELILYLDRAVHDYSFKLAEGKSTKLIKRMNVVEGADLPGDFLMFCGSVPINIEGNKISYYGEGEITPVKYFARLPLVSAYAGADELPYTNEECINIATRASVYARNKHDYDVSQDLRLLNNGVLTNARLNQPAQ